MAISRPAWREESTYSIGWILVIRSYAYVSRSNKWSSRSFIPETNLEGKEAPGVLLYLGLALNRDGDVPILEDAKDDFSFSPTFVNHADTGTFLFDCADGVVYS